MTSDFRQRLFNPKLYRDFMDKKKHTSINTKQ